MSAPLRRRLLAAAGIVLFGGPFTGARADDIGPVRPRVAAPAVRLLRHDGRTSTLAEQLRGSITVVQLMFTGCSAVCPLQGALFASLQARLSASGMNDVRLLSLSIDPLGDAPAALRGWLQRYGAGPRWQAAAPAASDLDRMLDFLGAAGQTLGDRHTTAISLLDREGRLAWRSGALPPVNEVLQALQWLRG